MRDYLSLCQIIYRSRHSSKTHSSASGESDATTESTYDSVQKRNQVLNDSVQKRKNIVSNLLSFKRIYSKLNEVLKSLYTKAKSHQDILLVRHHMLEEL